MAGDILSVLYLAVYLWAGWELAQRVLKQEKRTHTAVLGCAFGVALLAVLPAAFALPLGFALPAALAALAAAAAAGCAARFAPRKGGASAAGAGLAAKQTQKAAACRPGADTAAMLACCAPCLLLTVWLLYTHVLRYDAAAGAYFTGQSGYGDVAMHLAFIKSIAVQGKMPPAYPLLAGQALFGYPFLCESVSSIFLVLGAGLKFAYILPEVPALAALFGGVWLLAESVLGTLKKACAAFWLFFFGGGFGFAYYVGSKAAFLSIFTGYYTTPCNDIAHNIRWVEPIADMLVPQRATLMGWALAFPCLWLLYRFAFAGEKRLWLPLGLLAGCLPLMQTHSLLALVLMSAVYFAFAVGKAVKEKDARSLLPWLGYAAAAGVLCVPQLFGVIFRQTGTGNNFLRVLFNWCNHGTGENYFWFYIKNLGLIYLVQLPAFLWARRPLRRFYLGGLAVLAAAEFIVFQPNEYDNNKLLFFWFMLCCLLAADALCDWLALIPKRGVRAVLATGAAVVCLLSGVLTVGREIVSNYQVFSADGMTVAEYIDDNAARDALFLTGTEHLNPVVCLAGRSIVCGSSLYIYYHGMDYGVQEAAVRELYEAPSEAVLAQWGVGYVFISSYERANYAVDAAWYAARYPVWYRLGEYTIYRVAA